MDNTETLREALLDLEESRRREKEARQISEVILAGLHAIVLAGNPDEIFYAVLNVLSEPLDIKDAFVLTEQRDGTMTVTASSDPSFANTIWQPQSMFERVLAGQPIAVYDTKLVEEWRSQPDPIRERARAALHFAIHTSQPRTLFVCTHSDPAHFSKQHVTLARRFSVLAAEALQKIESNTEIICLKQVEKDLQERNALINRSEAIAHIGSWEMDPETNQLNWSDETYRIFGLCPQEFPATYEDFLEITHPNDRAAVDAAYSGSLRKGRQTYDIEHRIIRRETGEIRVVHEKCEHIRDDSGRVVLSVGMVHDITDRKRAEEKLKIAYQQLSANEEKLRNIIENSTNIFYSHTPDHKLTYLSPQAKKMIGYTTEEASIKWTELTSDNPINEKGFELTVKAIESGKAQPPYELELLHKSGAKVWVEVREIPIVKDGKTVSIVGALINITERKQADEELEKYREHLEELVRERTSELKKSEERFRAIFESSKDCILVWDRNYNYLCANQAAIDHVGTTRDKVIGKNIRDGLGHLPKFMRLWMSRVDRVFKTGEPMQVADAGTIGDQTVYSESVLTPLRDAGGKMFAVGVVYRDITNRKKDEEDLKEKIKELEIFHDATVDRELRMEELRVEIEKLKSTDTHR